MGHCLRVYRHDAVLTEVPVEQKEALQIQTQLNVDIINQERHHISPSPTNGARTHLPISDVCKIMTHTWIEWGLLLTGAQAPPGLQMHF